MATTDSTTAAPGRIPQPALQALRRGLVIPACPLALNARREWDERRQRLLLRYYFAAGTGGVAIGVHTTQFAIREPKIGLFQPLLKLAAEEFLRAEQKPAPNSAKNAGGPVRIGGICGATAQALAEAALLREHAFHAGLLSLGALREASVDMLLAHCRAVAEIIPIVGFYLQPAAGGRGLPFNFWRRFAEIENVVAIKIAPFNRYQTLDVVRAVVEAGRDDIALYTGNDDNIVMDLVTPFRFARGGNIIERRIVGGLLGHWAVWTRRAVELLDACHRVATRPNDPWPAELLRWSVEVTDANAAFFDAANGYAGCIAGLHEVLRRQGLLKGIWCLDANETLSLGQAEEIDRVCRAYPQWNDNEFVAQLLAEWEMDG